MKILIVEDDNIAATTLAKSLQAQSMVTQIASDGQSALLAVGEESFDVIVMDRMMPKMDGIEALGKMRRQGIATPVLILSALGEVDERVEGLEAGGDDYLVKPYALSELIARLNVLYKRNQTVQDSDTEWLTAFGVKLNTINGKVFRDGERIHLQPQERKLLEYFLRHANQVMTRKMLLEKVWDFHFETDSNLIDTQISRLRTKVDKPFSTALIHTIRGKGYVFSKEPSLVE
ncbi:response regulator transcription factor [Hydrogenovibrio marinus]|uniref:PhoB family transcriptional regulator n=1 Tax=Hydrogenovibrio marinus TaxID=28885 RepID=A0A066ZTB7_HYDMR|nr:response regulator transcription factor [Hydrogenovibrio marinus]KDN96702.1 PhoB family transcriptional regulator [Hydrogenovibrio marinus]BBN58939.1 DNA-binding response regulator [Hydrogenovibrio marinus]